VLARIAADGALYKNGHVEDECGRPITGISFKDYLDRLNPPVSTRDLLSAWWTVSGSAAHDKAPASEILWSLRYGEWWPDGICSVWDISLIGGVESLCQRMFSDTGIDLNLSTAVSTISHNASEVTALTLDDRSFVGDALIVATGLNPLAGITFLPPLPEDKAEAIRVGHPGRAIKIWVRATGLPVGVLATGGGGGIEWMLFERALPDGSVLLVGFGIERAPGEDLQRLGAEALARFFPEASFIAADGHDWNADPWSRGTWVTAPMGAEDGITFANWHRHGRLAFASSDIAEDSAGWFEAAAISGESAAREVLQTLGHG
jgi:monoamine oxidase